MADSLPGEFFGFEPLLTLEDKERAGPAALGWDLDRMTDLLAALGHPERRMRCTLVSGSKGKGSTACLLEAMLRADGRRTGLYTSPHLHRYAERILVDGQPVVEEESRWGLGQVLAHRRQPVTAFEVATAFAIWQFARAGVEEAVVESGFGGAQDATAAVDPQVVLLGPIEREHTALFGSDITDVARAEAALCQGGRIVWSTVQPEEVGRVLKASAEARVQMVPPATALPGGRFALATREGVLQGALLLQGGFQRANLALAAAGADSLGCSAAAILQGAQTAWLAGRLETILLRPQVLVDSAHTVQSARALAAALAEAEDAPRTVCIVGLLTDKDALGFCTALAPVVDALWAVRPASPRAMSPTVLEEAARWAGIASVSAEGIGTALADAMAAVGSAGRVVVTGSLRVVAEARALMSASYPPTIPRVRYR